MNSHSFSKTTRALAAGVLSAVMAVAPVFAQGHGGSGGGGGHMGGGGGGAHFSGGGHAMGGGHFGGAPRGFAGGGAHSFAGPRAFTAPRSFVGGGGHPVVAQHIAPHVGVAAGIHGVPRASWAGHPGGWTGHPGGWTGRPGWNGRPGWGHGYSGHYWAGGVWGGSYWPRVSYGWGFPLFLAALPLAYSTYYWGGIPYYYANDAYYTWDSGQSGYVVTDPPPVAGTAEDSSGVDNSGQPAQSNDVYAYPQNGQSEEQQSNDRYECHTWARSQTGYDPTHPNAQQGNSGDYQRAMKACLDARGYSTR